MTAVPTESATGLAGQMTDRAILAVAFVVGLFLRIVAAGFQGISHDAAAYYLPNARVLLDHGLGAWEGMTIAVPPLFPTLVAILAPLCPADGNDALELAAISISVIAGAATVFPVRGLTRLFFPDDPRVVRLAVILAALQPQLVLFGGDARADSLYACIFSSAIWAGATTLMRPGLRIGALFGVLVGVAYLLRPEALGLPLLLAFGCVLRLVGAWRGGGPVAPLLRRIVVAGVAGFLLLLPCLAWNVAFVHQKLGIYTLSPKAGILLDFDKDDTDPFGQLNDAHTMTLHEERLSDPGSYRTFSLVQMFRERPGDMLRAMGRNLSDFALYFPECLGVAPLLLFLGGLWFARGRTEAHGLAILIGVVGFFGLSFSIFYVTRRFCVPFLPLMLPWCGLGWASLETLRSRSLSPKLVATIVLVVTLCQTIYFTGIGRNPWFGMPERVVGEKLRGKLGGGVLYTSHKGKVTFHADGDHLRLPNVSPLEAIIDYMRHRGSSYLLVDRAGLERRRPRAWVKTLWGSIDASSELELVFRETLGGHDFHVFRVRP